LIRAECVAAVAAALHHGRVSQGFEGQYTKRFRALFTNYGITEYDFIFVDDTAIDDTQVRGCIS
jgi:hypothetical protein